jgi:signal transduction histidine kinase
LSAAPDNARLGRSTKLRTVLLGLSVLLLAIPLVSLLVMRVYESSLLRYTENSLIGQAAVVAEAYRVALEGAATDPELAEYGRQITENAPTEIWRPRHPQLDFASEEVQPPPPPAASIDSAAATFAIAAGQRLQPVLDASQKTTLSGTRIVDPDGRIVAATTGDVGRALVGRYELQAALGGVHESLLRTRASDSPPPAWGSISRGAAIRVYVAYPIVRGDRVVGAVLLHRTPRTLEESLYDQRGVLLAALLAVVAACLFVVLIMRRLVVLPLQKLARHAQTAGDGSLDIPPVDTSLWTVAEVAEVHRAVASMADALRARAQHVRVFAAQASHGFKTPLAAMKGAVELMRDFGDTMSSEDRVRFLRHMDVDITRLEQQVAQSLELARAEGQELAGGTCAANETVEAVVARQREAGVRIELRPLPAETAIPIRAEHLDTILTCLVDNAVQHGASGEADSSIEIGVEDGEERIVITVVDHGPGVCREDVERIFEPFFTTARGRGRTGLGLAVARRLAEGYGGTLTVVPTDAPGATFHLGFDRC